jgi:hypothetical protein
MESREYAAERNKYARDGLWKIGGSRHQKEPISGGAPYCHS